jgi:hypothetical protein
VDRKRLYKGSWAEKTQKNDDFCLKICDLAFMDAILEYHKINIDEIERGKLESLWKVDNKEISERGRALAVFASSFFATLGYSPYKEVFQEFEKTNKNFTGVKLALKTCLKEMADGYLKQSTINLQMDGQKQDIQQYFDLHSMQGLLFGFGISFFTVKNILKDNGASSKNTIVELDKHKGISTKFPLNVKKAVSLGCQKSMELAYVLGRHHRSAKFDPKTFLRHYFNVLSGYIVAIWKNESLREEHYNLLMQKLTYGTFESDADDGKFPANLAESLDDCFDGVNFKKEKWEYLLFSFYIAVLDKCKVDIQKVVPLNEKNYWGMQEEFEDVKEPKLKRIKARVI